MVTNKEKLFKLGAKMTDRAAQMLGLKKITEEDPEYWGLCNVLDDEMVDIALAIPQRKPQTFAQIKALVGWDDDKKLEDKLFEMSCLGVLEYNWENENHEKQWMLPLFVPGCAEFLNMRMDTIEKYPEVTEMFNQMARLPLEAVTPMVPPGGAGVGMHVIPVEKAIPAESKSVSVEHLSEWLKKYDYFSVGVCSCRRVESFNGRGSGDLPEYWCIAVGDCARYCDETGKDGLSNISYDQVMEILQRAEEEGYVHQITNIDGEDKIFAICNCAIGVCYGLRTSQLFNTPNMSRSAYIAHVDKEKCVACGKCVEVCPSGAAKLGQKLCTKNGPVKYPKHKLPDDNPWGPEEWDENYKDNNQINCYDTGTSPCKTACPAHIAVQGYIKMAAEGRYLDALKLIKQDNPFPAVCGAICNRRCEDACTRGTVDQPVAIDEIKKFIAEQELKAETRFIPDRRTKRLSKEDYEEKMAVIGAGPAGLSCAYYLRNMGYPVTVFEKEKQLGGMLTLGIPNFRLEKDVVNAEIEVLKIMGVEFRTGVEIGKDMSLDDIRADGYKAIFLGIGAQKSSSIGVPGEELKGVIGGVDFMKEVNLGKEPKLGKKVVIIGGGNVAMDVARTAIRMCDDVTVVYRRKESDMPADKQEVAEAKEEGVKFLFEYKPVEILGDKKVKALKCEAGEVECDTIISAIGQKVDLGGIAPEAMTFTAKGTVIADGLTLQTEQKDIFVGGDAFTGPKFAIDAIAAGHEAAISMHRFVHPGQSLTLARNRRDFIELNKDDIVLGVGSFDTASRQVPGKDASKAKSFSDEKITFTEEQVKKEAARCLGCGATEVDENKCIGCGLCTTRCEFDAIHLSRDLPEASTMCTAEDKMKLILPYMAKREVNIIKKKFAKK